MTQHKLSEDDTIAVSSLDATGGATGTPGAAAGLTPDAASGIRALTGGRLDSMPPPGEGYSREVLGGRYELLRLIGAGGMGNVYLARDRELDEEVALKTLRREIADKPGIIERFRREVRLSRRVTHPNVARVFDIGEHGGDKFLTMEYVEGESLADVLAREGALAIGRAVEIIRAVCAGLGAAHKAGVIHRDLKPDNVLIAKDGRVVLTDFGIARALEALDGQGDGGNTVGVTLGTPAYMAPEQVQGRDDIDARADIYALGAMLYEMCTGERAWRGDGAFAVAAAKLMADPPDPRSRRPDLPAAFARLILRCMARERGDRFASAEAVADEVATLTQPAAPAAAQPAPPESPRAGPERCQPPAAVTGPGEKIVAVLPFRNQGPAGDEFLADELTDDLIDTLSMTQGLKVRPRGVVARWKSADQDPREIGRELGVQVVVDGSVRRRAGSVRISARLISVADGFQLWARRLDRPEQEVLRMSDEVAQAIAEALTVEGSAAPAREAPTDPVAVELFLRARHEYRKFWPPSQRIAIALYEQALARAPGDPMITAGLALSRCRLWFFSGEGGALAVEAAERAAKAAPDLPEARLALASVRFQHGEAVTTVKELKQALARNPSLAEAQALLGSILLEAGEIAEGNRWVEASLALDPLTPMGRPTLARSYALTGRWSDAYALLGQNRAADDHWGVRTRLALWRGDADDAEQIAQELERREANRGFVASVLYVMKHEKLPETPEFVRNSQGSGVALRRNAFAAQLTVEMACYVKDIDRAFNALEASVGFGLIDLFWLERCPPLALLREDPRYAPLHAAVRRRAEAILQAYRQE